MPDYTPYPVELVTPEGFAFQGDAQMLVAPGAAGQLGVLANHAPLGSLLTPGEVRITDEGGQLHRFAVDDGFLQVRQNRALVLVGEAVSADDIDAAEANRRLEAARAALEHAESGAEDADEYAARRELGFAEALVKTAGR
jgi:F-type H+-transporting ATPase subunit epsilon